MASHPVTPCPVWIHDHYQLSTTQLGPLQNLPPHSPLSLKNPQKPLDEHVPIWSLHCFYDSGAVSVFEQCSPFGNPSLSREETSRI